MMTLRIWGEVALDYLGGSNVTAKVLVRRRQDDQRQSDLGTEERALMNH